MDMGGMMDGEMPSSPLGGEMGSDDEPFEPKNEEEREIADFMDDTKPMAERVMAFHEAVRLCMEEGHDSPGGSKKPPAGLALVFGDKEKKD